MSTNNVIMEGEMLAPEQEGKKKREGLEIVDEGPQEFLCIGVIQLGTHTENYADKGEKIQPKIMIIWEKCDLKQLIYEDDTEPRSFIKYDEMTFYTNTKSRLYKVAKAVFGKEKKEDDIVNNKINFMEMLGRRAYLNIEHVEKKDGDIYPKITGYAVCKKAADEDFITDGNQYGWYLDAAGKNFMHPAFANLPLWIREKIMASEEGKAHKEAGGKFAEPERSENEESSSKGSSKKVNEVSVPEGWEFKDPNNEYTYSEFLAAGWTNNQLAKKGYLTKSEKPKGPAAPPKDEPKKPEPAAPKPDEDDDDYNPFAVDDDDDDLPF